MLNLAMAVCGLTFAAITIWQVRRDRLAPLSARDRLIQGTLGGLGALASLLALVIGESESWGEAAFLLGLSAFSGSFLLEAVARSQRERETAPGQ